MVVWACLVQERVLKVAAEQAFPDVESVGEAMFGCKQLWCAQLREDVVHEPSASGTLFGRGLIHCPARICVDKQGVGRNPGCCY